MTDYEELGKRAVKCKTWRWMPGMLATSTNSYHRPARIEAIDGDSYGLTVIPDCNGPVFSSHHEWGIAGSFPRGCTVPDLTDPATVGCLLHLVREHWGDGGSHTRRLYRYGGGEKWLCVSPSVVYPAIQTHGETEAECLVKALEMEIPND